MRPHALQDGVHPHGKAGSDSRELHGACQEGALAAAAARVEIGALSTRLEPDGLVRLATVDKLRCQHTPGTLVPGHGLAIRRQGLVDDAEGVALAQFPVEVDVTGKDLGHLRGHRIWNPGLIGGRKQ